MKFVAEIDVLPLKALLDPQGKAVNLSIHNMGFKQVSDVRIGKHITIELTADDEKEAGNTIDELCKKILINPIIEDYHFAVKKC